MDSSTLQERETRINLDGGMASVTPKERERLFELIKEHCTNIAIKRLSQQYSDIDSEIRISGPAESLHSNLMRAASRGTISDDELIHLLAGAEESGHQHILYYLPKDRAVSEKCNAYASIERALLNGKTRNELKLPHYYLDLNDVKISDFRLEQIPNSEYSSWTLKFYSGMQRAKYLGIKELGNGMFSREYQRYNSREVLLVKWHSFGLLELRIGTYGSMSRKSFTQDVTNMWAAVGGAVDRTEFGALDLGKATTSLVQNAEARKSEYILGNADFDDGEDGSISFNPADPEDNLIACEVRKKAMANLKDCSRLVITWLNPKDDKNLPDRLRTEIGLYLPNELRIGAQTTPEAVTYVTNRLRELAK